MNRTIKLAGRAGAALALLALTACGVGEMGAAAAAGGASKAEEAKRATEIQAVMKQKLDDAAVTAKEMRDSAEELAQ